MAAINDLIRQITDPDLRDRIQKEVDKLAKQKKFGLVFEEHLPECTPLYDIPVRRGVKAALKAGDVSDFYQVLKVEDGKAICIKRGETEAVEFPVEDLVTIAEFGEPIYPYLKPIDTVCNAPDSDLWHTLIEADNYHALQLLEFLYAGKVDCIYIDPPYNTGARDWKYNNDYVDGADTYRHSKWLSFIEKRLLLAKRLLNPRDSVLIITIDEKEYLHLGCLLEELFPEARIQMVSSIIARNGSQRRDAFSRANEYIFFVQFGASTPIPLALTNEWIVNGDTSITSEGFQWGSFVRQGAEGKRESRPNMFYPIFVSEDGKRFVDVGDPLPLGVDRSTVQAPEGTIAIWPLHSDGSEGRWAYANTGAKDLAERGFLRLGKLTKKGMGISYAATGAQQKIESGEIPVKGRREDGSWIVDTENVRAKFLPITQWNIQSHDATYYGTNILASIIGKGKFSFPKSVYATHDAIRFFVEEKKNALIIDFFAGSGTTLHAVNLLNSEDGGNRRCIIITNNEVSDSEAKALTAQGYKPGDDEWEKLGIARNVTWPRTVCSIEGHDIDGKPLKGTYLGSNLPMANGFKANVAFFKLGFLNRTTVALGMQFKEMLPLLWMKTGAIGICPEMDDDTSDMLILPENKFAVLINENVFASFEEALQAHPDIQTVFIVTDYEVNYRAMVKSLGMKTSYQLYRDYLDNFRINHGRN